MFSFLHNADIFSVQISLCLVYLSAFLVRISFFYLFCCYLLVSNCSSWVHFHVVCVVLLWFASLQCKMHIALWGRKLQKYYTYNFGGNHN
jgi:hypothetical protein